MVGDLEHGCGVQGMPSHLKPMKPMNGKTHSKRAGACSKSQSPRGLRYNFEDVELTQGHS